MHPVYRAATSLTVGNGSKTGIVFDIHTYISIYSELQNKKTSYQLERGYPQSIKR